MSNLAVLGRWLWIPVGRTGRADIMVDPICNAWDVAAILPVVVEAGGEFTDWKGNPTVRGGDGLGTNGLLHEATRRILAC